VKQSRCGLFLRRYLSTERYGPRYDHDSSGIRTRPANHGWLDTHHRFSFASYHDPRHMGFRSLAARSSTGIA
jgi:hypothetical protein